jgi:hypothetical protein
MTLCAIMIKISGGVIRVCRAVEVCLMAGIAIRSRACVTPVSVALLAVDGRVSSGQLKPRQIMIEPRRLPSGLHVTLIARMAVVPRRVIGIRGGHEGRQVATIARDRQIHILAVGMT